MKRLLFYLNITLLPLAHLKGQPLSDGHQWKIYLTNGIKPYRIKVDSLRYYPSAELNPDSAKKYLSNLSQLSKDQPPLWMGGFAASCLINGVLRKFDISSYGGFLFDEQDRLYYLLPDDLQSQWISFITNTLVTLESNIQGKEK